MHEATIAQFILEKSKQISLRQIEKLNTGEERSLNRLSIASINIRVGAFRNVEIESLLFAFDALKKDDILTRRASLEIELINIVALCKNGHRYTPEVEKFFACSVCNMGMESVLEGKELEITCVKVEELDVVEAEKA